MRTRIPAGSLAAAALSILLLASCSAAPTPQVTEEVVAVADISGDWLSTRTLVETTHPEGVIGTEYERLLIIEDVECDDAGACVGTLTSSSTVEGLTGDDDTLRSTAEVTFEGDNLSWAFPTEYQDCTYSDDSIAYPEAWEYTFEYTFALSDTSEEDGGEIATSFVGTAVETWEVDPQALEVDCPGSVGNNFDVELTRR